MTYEKYTRELERLNRKMRNSNNSREKENLQNQIYDLEERGYQENPVQDFDAFNGVDDRHYEENY